MDRSLVGLRVIVFVFHYNRGRFLENALRSIDLHIRAPVIIVDDGSTDKESLEILDRFSKTYQVFIKPAQGSSDRVTGGLHANMQWALSFASQQGAELALMVQDDMQIVRDVLRDDINVVTNAFNIPDASFVLQTCFLKANSAGRLDDNTMREVIPGIYERTKTDAGVRAGKCFSYADTGFFSVPLFQKLMGTMKAGEKSKELAAHEKGLRLRFMANPFMHFLPLPSDLSKRDRRWQDRLSDYLAGANIHPVRSMTEEQATYFIERNKSIMPYAEDFLEVPTLPRCNYWSLRSGRSNLHSRGGWRKALARILPK
jgi:glycosyltransferase involved in cell wall biosynthesis